MLFETIGFVLLMMALCGPCVFIVSLDMTFQLIGVQT